MVQSWSTNRCRPLLHTFLGADGTLFSETYNQLNAYFATIPGNYRHNLRRHYLLNSNYADISFLFTIQLGETWNDHLDREYLAVLETDNATPYYLNLHNREVAHTLILGATGSVKRSSGNMSGNSEQVGKWSSRYRHERSR